MDLKLTHSPSAPPLSLRSRRLRSVLVQHVNQRPVTAFQFQFGNVSALSTTAPATPAAPGAPNTSNVRLLGDPVLRQICKPVGNDDLRAEKAALANALESFRAEHGFGRGIAAPQIGVPRRFVALNLGGRPRLLSDPKIEWRSKDTVTLWDDCMSLPWVLCRVRRHKSISVAFVNEDGNEEVWERLPMAASELLQHEIDHLDGTLITDLMMECSGDGKEVMVSREAYEADPKSFDALVDVHITPCEYPIDVKILS